MLAGARDRELRPIDGLPGSRADHRDASQLCAPWPRERQAPAGQLRWVLEHDERVAIELARTAGQLRRACAIVTGHLPVVGCRATQYQGVGRDSALELDHERSLRAERNRLFTAHVTLTHPQRAGEVGAVLGLPHEMQVLERHRVGGVGRQTVADRVLAASQQARVDGVDETARDVMRAREPEPPMRSVDVYRTGQDERTKRSLGLEEHEGSPERRWLPRHLDREEDTARLVSERVRRRLCRHQVQMRRELCVDVVKARDDLVVARPDSSAAPNFELRHRAGGRSSQGREPESQRRGRHRSAQPEHVPSIL